MIKPCGSTKLFRVASFRKHPISKRKFSISKSIFGCRKIKLQIFYRRKHPSGIDFKANRADHSFESYEDLVGRIWVITCRNCTRGVKKVAAISHRGGVDV